MIAKAKNGVLSAPSTHQPIAILGVVLDNVSLTQALHRVEAMIASRQPHYIVTANADFLVQALDDRGRQARRTSSDGSTPIPCSRSLTLM